jgi:hypothetical protein
VNRTPALFGALRREIETAPMAELAAIRGELAAVEAELLVRLFTPQGNGGAHGEDASGGDHLLDVKAAAKKLDMSERFLYEHASEYGGAKYGGSLKFSAKRLDSIIRRRSYA